MSNRARAQTLLHPMLPIAKLLHSSSTSFLTLPFVPVPTRYIGEGQERPSQVLGTDLLQSPRI